MKTTPDPQDLPINLGGERNPSQPQPPKPDPIKEFEKGPKELYRDFIKTEDNCDD